MCVKRFGYAGSEPVATTGYPCALMPMAQGVRHLGLTLGRSGFGTSERSNPAPVHIGRYDVRRRFREA